jgi:hypothetical protein
LRRTQKTQPRFPVFVGHGGKLENFANGRIGRAWITGRAPAIHLRVNRFV